MILTALFATAMAWNPLTLNARVLTLDNGLTVVLEEDHRTDTIALHMSYGVGSADEGVGQTGAAHLFEHLTFEGTANVPAGQFDQWLAEAGGVSNAYTTVDQTVYHMAIPSSALELALFLESERMGFLAPAFSNIRLATQKKIVLRERAQGYAEPHGRDWDELMTLVYPADHPYHHSVIGQVDDIKAFDLNDARAFYARHYSPSNAVLVLVGNFDAAEVQLRVEHWFSDVQRGPVAELLIDNSPVQGRAHDHHGQLDRKVMSSGSDQSVYLAWVVPRISEEDGPALEVLTWMLSAGRGTRLDDRLYYDHLLTTDSSASYQSRDLAGELSIYAISANTSPKRLARIIQRQLKKIAKHPPDAEEVQRAVDNLRAAWLGELSAIEGRAGQLSWCYRKFGVVNSCAVDLMSRYSSVTPEDISRVAASYLTKEQRSLLVGLDGE